MMGHSPIRKRRRRDELYINHRRAIHRSNSRLCSPHHSGNLLKFSKEEAMTRQTDEEIVKQKYPNAEIGYEPFGICIVLKLPLEEIKHWYSGAFKKLSGLHYVASMAWADAAQRIESASAQPK